MNEAVILTLARRNQFDLLYLLMSSHHPQFGAHMDDRVRFISGPRLFTDWYHREANATAIQVVWTRLLHDCGILAPATPGMKPLPTAIFCVPALHDDPAGGYNRGQFIGTIQVRRTADHRVLCWASAQVMNHSLLMPAILARLRLDVIGPVVMNRRTSAGLRDVYKDNVVDVALRLESSLTEEDREGFLLDQTVETPIVCYMPMLRQILLVPKTTGSGGTSLFFALIDLVCHLREWRVAADPKFHVAPTDNLDKEVVMGEIARYAFIYATRTNGVAKVVRLFIEEEQQEDPRGVRAQFDSRGLNLLLCPLNYNDHWTLLYRLPGASHSTLFDSAALSETGESRHGQHASQFASHIKLLGVPQSQQQVRRECGIFVVAVAAWLIRTTLAADPRHPRTDALRLMARDTYVALSAFWQLDPDVRDREVIAGLIAVLWANYDSLLE
jgi:hypothetical protein